MITNTSPTDLIVNSIWAMQTKSSMNDAESWTEACLVERLKEHLARVKVRTSVKKLYDDRKYYNLCYNLLLLGAYKPSKQFPLSVSDLPCKLLKELDSLDKDDRMYVLKQAVGRIFEDINARLYHNSISRVLEVVLVD